MGVVSERRAGERRSGGQESRGCHEGCGVHEGYVGRSRVGEKEGRMVQCRAVLMRSTYDEGAIRACICIGEVDVG
jgi:hypothetical protein